MSTTTEAQVKQIVGSCSEITEKNGWVQFSIDAGLNYPVRLSTKLPALIEQARTVGDARSTWTYKESQGGENPNRPGTYYTNRYLEKVEIGGTAEVANGPANAIPSQSASSQTDNGMTPEKWDAKERRDYRSRAWAQTLGAFTHTISVNDKPEDVFLRLQPFQRKIFNDVCESFAYPQLTEHDENIPFA